ncbi:DUF3857 domain-containing transglutaminase family protein [Pseudoalteromonas ruthenica]|uniref:Transglutaminase n=1 Tax=Pseudoalteromonas ruthenica TaxID=151081 RepID=A0A0F4PPL4_9GAMM|nr:DUF3857 domain-containing transglutaminase family protein [Pseudoalteromonas ruthenica]KJY95379.1 hypothetical protein TW72_18285 [Pseudoalteromonas ruthenica]KJY96196.1 hypothetical protein TW76_12225 [Pseudoalteromonas ruthenica]TMO84937.1 DUF3857 domain-containing protein [Pseudoalteromonas ruthenica]TMO92254.1 DUF3857 domain-containing protein [Pseudoalteromonas ruthenica]TMO96831.1 DUF3857 domain-containing protein [Pseudoalteromonas ruthenica]
MIRILLLCWLLACTLTPNTALANYQITPAADWVAPAKLPPLVAETIPTEQLSDGTYYRLLEDQIQVPGDNPNAVSHYIRYVMHATNQSGVENISQLNLDYDPSYQRIELNHLRVIRDGQVIDKISTAQLKVLQRETEAEQLIYDGTQTLNIIVDDVRPGDSLDYAFTRIGRNPIYQGRFSYSAQLDWSVPVAEQYIRIDWQKPQPLHIQQNNGDAQINVTDTANGKEYSLYITSPDMQRYDSQTPLWHDPYHMVFFSEFNRWQEVVDWALPMYQQALSTGDDITAIAEQIRQQHPTLPAQIGAALKYTQDEIRYLGLEMGSNSHLPTPAQETLQNRYGDCKDKTVLLISILRALGVEAHPALVNTQLDKGLAETSPSSARFNHVLVTLEHDGERYWLDPTTSYQTGSLLALSEPDFGYALIVKPSQNTLTSMHKPVERIHRDITERYELPNAKEPLALFSVQSIFSDADAISKRQELATTALQTLQENYTNYYQDYFAGTQHTRLPQVREHPQKGAIEVTEFYQIDDFWSDEENGQTAYFYADDIQNAIYQPDTKTRISPLYLQHPYNVNYTIEVKLNERDWYFNNSKSSIDNPYFSLASQVRFSSNTLTLTYQFRSKTDHVPVAEMPAYLDAREQLLDATQYGIRQAYSHVNEAEQDNFLLLGYAVIGYCILALVVITAFVTLWRVEAGKRPTFSEQRYYPVSTVKFCLYSLLTFNIFPFYWCYKNWQYIKQQHNEAVMPIARGFFAWLWYYPLYLRFYQEGKELGTQQYLPPKWLAALFAILVVVLHIATSLDFYGTVFYLVWPLLWLPLVNYTAHINQRNDSLPYYSRWRVRQVLLAVVLLPILTLGLAQDIGLTANVAVVSGDKVWQHDKRFMLRHGVLNQNEQLLYFYSDAAWNIRDDGNGITEQGVFSYYRDQGQLQVERADFGDIVNVHTEFANQDDGYTTIDIERADGSSFRLILSSEEKGDNKFVQALQTRWRQPLAQ